MAGVIESSPTTIVVMNLKRAGLGVAFSPTLTQLAVSDRTGMVTVYDAEQNPVCLFGRVDGIEDTRTIKIRQPLVFGIRPGGRVGVDRVDRVEDRRGITDEDLPYVQSGCLAFTDGRTGRPVYLLTTDCYDVHVCDTVSKRYVGTLGNWSATTPRGIATHMTLVAVSSCSITDTAGLLVHLFEEGEEDEDVDVDPHESRTRESQTRSWVPLRVIDTTAQLHRFPSDHPCRRFPIPPHDLRFVDDDDDTGKVTTIRIAEPISKREFSYYKDGTFAKCRPLNADVVTAVENRAYIVSDLGVRASSFVAPASASASASSSSSMPIPVPGVYPFWHVICHQESVVVACTVPTPPHPLH